MGPGSESGHPESRGGPSSLTLPLPRSRKRERRSCLAFSRCRMYRILMYRMLPRMIKKRQQRQRRLRGVAVAAAAP